GRSTGGDFAHAFGLRARFAQVYEIRAPNFSRKTRAPFGVISTARVPFSRRVQSWPMAWAQMTAPTAPARCQRRSLQSRQARHRTRPERLVRRASSALPGKVVVTGARLAQRTVSWSDSERLALRGSFDCNLHDAIQHPGNRRHGKPMVAVAPLLLHAQ